MKLEVGQFVRFKDKRGNEYIRKIVEIPEDNRYASLYLDKDANYSKGLSIKNVIKASYNIIDLIEVGDILVDDTNRKLEVYYDEELDYLYVQCIDGDNNLYCESIRKQSFINNIKSIVTKEQFEQMSYKVGSDK